jgi:hypothetical protein
MAMTIANTPNSQKAAHTLGSAPRKSCLILWPNMAQEHAADPGSGSCMCLTRRAVALLLLVAVTAGLTCFRSHLENHLSQARGYVPHRVRKNYLSEQYPVEQIGEARFPFLQQHTACKITKAEGFHSVGGCATLSSPLRWREPQKREKCCDAHQTRHSRHEEQPRHTNS